MAHRRSKHKPRSTVIFTLEVPVTQKMLDETVKYRTEFLHDQTTAKVRRRARVDVQAVCKTVACEQGLHKALRELMSRTFLRHAAYDLHNDFNIAGLIQGHPVVLEAWEALHAAELEIETELREEYRVDQIRHAKKLLRSAGYNVTAA
jgi:hypothetical protein